MKWLIVFLTLVLAGCDVPLPGGAPSGPSYEVTAEFSDVLDLVPQAAVKVNDVTVGIQFLPLVCASLGGTIRWV